MKKSYNYSILVATITLLVFIACTETKKPTETQKYLNDRQKVQKSLVLIKNKNNTLPIKKIEKRKIANLNIGINKETIFQKTLEKYTIVDNFNLSFSANENQINNTQVSLNKYNTVFISFYSDSHILEEGIPPTLIKFINDLAKKAEVILTIFHENEIINHLGELKKVKSILLAQNSENLNQELAAEIIFGGTPAIGKLSETINDIYIEDFGISLTEQTRFSYTIPEAANLDSKILNHKIDSIAKFAIARGAFPGCQVLVAKDMKLIFHESYGFHTFSKKQKVQKTDIYDLASVTKIAAATLALMKLYGDNHFLLNNKFSDTWTDWKKTDKKNLSWREILAHQAGLKPWIPYWADMVDKKGNYKKNYLQKDSSDIYNTKIGDNLFLRSDFKQEVYEKIKETKLSTRGEYKYSGLSFYLFPEIVKRLTGTEFEEFLKEEFYKNLGANTLTFNAFEQFPLSQIIPTEKDILFRKKQIHGRVHDEGAAIMGGVSGNAGLFGSANDLAKLMQMFLNMGNYGGKQLLRPTIVKEFTRIQYPHNENHRGLGFDKPLIGNDKIKFPDAYPAPSASKKSFGHSGYTGTFVWADPETKIVFIFLSNRVFPTRNNNLIYKLNIRPAMHQAIYDAIF